MKKTVKLLTAPFAFVLMIGSFIACNEDFNDIDSAVLGEENSNITTNKVPYPVIAYNKNLEDLNIQVNDLNDNLLGVYKDPVFGTTTASIITQLTPASFSPDFGTSGNPARIDAVILRIPYYSRVFGANSSGNFYTINDSVYGEEFHGKDKQPFNLSIYESTYFLRSEDINSNTSQKYYSTVSNTSNSATDNGTTPINFDDPSNIGETILNTTQLKPSSETVLKFDENGVETAEELAPAIYFSLDKIPWQSKIVDAYLTDPSILLNANYFRAHFRGLFFKAEAENNDGTMLMLNLESKDANITIYYTLDPNGVNKSQETYVLNFSGQRLNTFVNDYTAAGLTDGDAIVGDDKIYLKGSLGSMGIVKLFEDPAALETFKNEYRISDGNDGYKLSKLINDAQLVIYEDELINNGGYEDLHKYDRIYAYDIKNNAPIIDYTVDPIQNLSSPYNSKSFSMGKRFKDADGSYKYKIRVTELIKDIILKDSTNTELGLVLSTNVNRTGNADILNEELSLPSISLITPRGTVLYGSNATDETKRMKLNLYITEPK